MGAAVTVPMERPDAASPAATARLVVKYCWTITVVERKSIPAPVPAHTKRSLKLSTRPTNGRFKAILNTHQPLEMILPCVKQYLKEMSTCHESITKVEKCERWCEGGGEESHCGCERANESHHSTPMAFYQNTECETYHKRQTRIIEITVPI